MHLDIFFEEIESPLLRDLARAIDARITGLVVQVVPCSKFGTVFYVYHRWLCYLEITKNSIELSFCFGNELSNTQKLLSERNTKGQPLAQVRKLKIQNRSDLDNPAIDEIIVEAALLNEIWAANRPSKRKPKR